MSTFSQAIMSLDPDVKYTIDIFSMPGCNGPHKVLVVPLSRGHAILEYNEPQTQEDRELFCAWINLMLRKIKSRVVKEPDNLELPPVGEPATEATNAG
jgi:hypothetical protein